MTKTNFEHYINNFSNFPFEVCVENEDPNYGSAVIRVYDDEDVVFTSRFYEDFNSYDLAGVIEEVLLWCWTPRKMSDNERQTLEFLWQQGWRFIRKGQEICYDDYGEPYGEPWDTLNVWKEENTTEASVDAFLDIFSEMEYNETYSIASLLGKEVM